MDKRHRILRLGLSFETLTGYGSVATVTGQGVFTVELFHEFKSSLCSRGGLNHSVCLGRKEFIENFIHGQEFSKLFGGYVLAVDPSGVEDLGVWSQRLSSRLRWLIRERGG